MSITIQAVPLAYSSIQGDLIYTVAEVVHTADPITYPNYKFVGDVYVGATLVARIKKVPDPVTKIGIFNVGQIVRNYMATTFNPTAAAIVAQRIGAGEFSLAVTMKFGEEYAFTTYTNLVTDSTRTFFNWYYGRYGSQGMTAFTDKVVSTRPLITPIRCDSSFNLIPFFPSDTDNITVRFKSYDYASALVTSYNLVVTPSAANELIIINASKTAINAGSPGMINDGVKYYTVQFDTPNISDDVTYRFNMDCECIFDRYTLHFLNKYGGFESKDFTKVSRKTIDIEKKDFGKLPYTVDSSGVVSYLNSNNVFNETRSVYSVQYKEKMVLNSDLLTDQEYAWLQDLILSPMVYIEDSFFHPVIIAETNYEPKKNVNDDLTNLTINIEFGQQLNAQYR
jgi:hypothetical protein